MSDIARCYVRKLQVVSSSGVVSSLDFSASLTVISGLYDTGKSYIIELLSFVLGKSELRDIKQIEPYDFVLLEIVINGSPSTFKRSVRGGAVDLFAQEIDKVYSVNSDGIDFIEASSSFQPKSEKFYKNFFERIGFNGYVGAGSKSAQKKITLRTLSKLFLVDETSIQDDNSLLWGGSHSDRVYYQSILKTVVTGKDFSTVSFAHDLTKDVSFSKKKGELDASEKILKNVFSDKVDEVEDDLIKDIKDIDAKIQEVKSVIQGTKRKINGLYSQYQANTLQYRVFSDQYEDVLARSERFDLLQKHYESDFDRLDSVIEASANMLSIKSDCALCKAPPEAQGLQDDEYISNLIQASQLEINKIEKLQSDLSAARTDLLHEKDSLSLNMTALKEKLSKESQELDRLNSIVISEKIQDLTTLISSKSVKERKLKSLQGQDFVRKHIQEIEKTINEKRDSASGDLNLLLPSDKMKEISCTMLSYLTSWGVLDKSSTIVFVSDEKVYDFEIDGKLRTSYGKGLRSLYKCAFIISLMDFCYSKGLPHPGFVFIDSPLTLAGDTSDPEYSPKLQNMDVKFYNSMAKRGNGQVVVIDNANPPVLGDDVVTHKFTGKEGLGRAGLLKAI